MITLLATVITEANTIVGLYLYSVSTNSMFLSTYSLSIVYTFPENISLFPLISWFVFYLILQAFNNQNDNCDTISLTISVNQRFLPVYYLLFLHLKKVYFFIFSNQNNMFLTVLISSKYKQNIPDIPFKIYFR